MGLRVEGVRGGLVWLVGEIFFFLREEIMREWNVIGGIVS